VLTLGLAAYPAGTVHGALRTVLGLLGVGAAGVLVVGLLARSTAPLPWSIGLLGISAAVAMLAGGGPVERAAPLYGPGLLLAAELAYWVVDRARVPGEPVGVARRRALLLVAMAVAAGLLALLVTLAGGLAEAVTGSEIRALGVGAAVMVTWILAVLARRAATEILGSGPALRYPRSHPSRCHHQSCLTSRIDSSNGLPAAPSSLVVGMGAYRLATNRATRTAASTYSRYRLTSPDWIGRTSLPNPPTTRMMGPYR
jgi:hypothetical protein